MNQDQRVAFFYQLKHLPPQQQSAKVKTALAKDPTLTNTVEFVQWGIEIADKL